MNGMAAHGGIRPFGSTFLVFSDYMKPSIRLAALMHLPVIYVFTHDSIGVGEDGPTHQPIEHLAMLRGVPNLVVTRPGRAGAPAAAWRAAVAGVEGPTANIRARQKRPANDHSAASADGARHGGYVLFEPEDPPEAIILATGMTIMGCFYMIPVQLAFFLELNGGATALMAGVAIAWMSFCAMTTSLNYGRLKHFAGPVWTVVLISGVMSVGFVTLGLSQSYAMAIVALTVIGLGFGPMIANQAGWLTDIALRHTRGRAVGGLTLAVFLGQFISTPAIQPVITAASYGAAFIVSGSVLAGLCAVYLLARPWLLRRTAALHAITPA